MEFEGRSRRSEYWYFISFSFLVVIVGTIVSEQLGNLLALGLAIPHITVSTRRIRDIGLSGWWAILFIPIVFPMLIVGLIDSKEAEPSTTDDKAKDMFQGVHQTIATLIKGKDSSITSADEEKIYEQVSEELANNIRKKGLWLKAFEKAEGDESKAKALYIRYRVQAIMDENEQERVSAQVVEINNKDEELQLTEEEEELERQRIAQIHYKRAQIRNKRAQDIAKMWIYFILFIFVLIVFQGIKTYSQNEEPVEESKVLPTMKKHTTEVELEKKIIEEKAKKEALEWNAKVDRERAAYARKSLEEAKKEAKKIERDMHISPWEKAVIELEERGSNMEPLFPK